MEYTSQQLMKRPVMLIEIARKSGVHQRLIDYINAWRRLTTKHTEEVKVVGYW